MFYGGVGDEYFSNVVARLVIVKDVDLLLASIIRKEHFIRWQDVVWSTTIDGFNSLE